METCIGEALIVKESPSKFHPEPISGMLISVMTTTGTIIAVANGSRTRRLKGVFLLAKKIAVTAGMEITNRTKGLTGIKNAFITAK